MKKTLLFGCILSLLISGCAGSQSAVKEFVPLNEIVQLYSTPKEYKNKYVELTGQIINTVEKDEKNTYFQMFENPSEGSGNTIVIYPNIDIELKEDDYVKVIGKVLGGKEAENAFGGKISLLQIQAESVEPSNYIEVESPTLKTIDVNSEQEQFGYKVKISKVELAEKETRVYLEINNNGAENFNLYSFNAKLVQNGQQFEEQDNWDAEYPEVQTDLMPGNTTSGIIAFPSVNQSDFELVFEASSDNWREDIQPYRFSIVVQ